MWAGSGPMQAAWPLPWRLAVIVAGASSAVWLGSFSLRRFWRRFSRSMAKQTTITSGPWTSVLNSSDTSEAYKDKLYAAQNQYRSGNSWPARPPFITTKAAGTLGTSGGRFGQCVFEHVALDGTVYRFVFVGGKVYRWDGNVTYTDVTPVLSINASALRIFCCSFADKLIVSDGTNPPWFVPSSGLGATPLVGTSIFIDSVPTGWHAFGQPVVFDARLFFIIDMLGSTKYRDTIVWSEVADPTKGYQQNNYANTWELFQTAPGPIYALAATEVSLVAFRERSMLCVTGKTDQTFVTNATRESVEGVGTTAPASVLVHNGVVWFVDSIGRQYRYVPGGQPEALWEQVEDTVSAALFGGLQGTPAQCAVAAYHPDLNLIVSTSYSHPSISFVASQIHVFDAETGTYNGTWDVDGLKLIHTLGIVRDQFGNISLCVLGENATNVSATGTSGQMWRQRTLGEMIGNVSWSDPNNSPTNVVVTHHLGRNEGAEWIFDRLTLRALTTAVIGTSGRTVSLNYYTPRGNTFSAPGAVLGSFTTTPLTGLQTWNFGSEVGAIWGLGVNARGPWLMATLSGPSISQTVPPFTPISAQLRGRAVPANPFIGVGAPTSLNTYVLDHFTRADSITSAGMADTGQTWLVGEGTWGISGNRLIFKSSGGSNRDALYIDSTVADCTVSVTLFLINSTGRIMWRYTDIDNYFMIDPAPGVRYDMYRRQAGSYNLIGTIAQAPVVGDVLSVTLSGSSITFKINGVTAITATDAFQATATKHGVAAGSPAVDSVLWDNFSVTVP